MADGFADTWTDSYAGSTTATGEPVYSDTYTTDYPTGATTGGGGTGTGTGYSDTYGDIYDGTTAGATTWQYANTAGLYPYLLNASGSLIPLYVQQIGPATDITVTPTVLSNGSIRLVWNLIAYSTGYQVTIDGTNPVNVTVGAGESQYLFTGLTNGARYTMTVRAVPNGMLQTLTLTAVNTGA